MNRIVLVARGAFVAMAVFLLSTVWDADTGAPNALLRWLRHIHNGDKYAHFVLYGLLAFFLHVGMRGRGWKFGPMTLPAAAVCVLVLGWVEEFSQWFLPRRNVEWQDLASNLAGVVFFTLVAHAVVIWMRRREAASGISSSD